MNLQEMIQKYIKNGYSDEFASLKVSQDLILTAIVNIIKILLLKVEALCIIYQMISVEQLAI